MNPIDLAFTAICAWRENRHGGIPGMTSVINCIMNRSADRKQTPYQVVVARLQFSSMTAPGDPQLGLYPSAIDAEWAIAQQLASQALQNQLQDITGGALSYYALSMAEPPYWASSMTPTVIIAGQQFMR